MNMNLHQDALVFEAFNASLEDIARACFHDLVCVDVVVEEGERCRWIELGGKILDGLSPQKHIDNGQRKTLLAQFLHAVSAKRPCCEQSFGKAAGLAAMVKGLSDGA